MQEIKLGKLIDESARRDAIHVALAPVVAGSDLKPGERVGLNENGEAVAHMPIGIVDPFLQSPIKKGERFYLLLFPGSVTSLRHEWTHPAFADEQISGLSEKQISEVWLREYARKMNCYEQPEQAFITLIDGLMRENLYAHGSDCHGLYDVDDYENLRFHAERYLGRPVVWERFTFSCSC